MERNEEQGPEDRREKGPSGLPPIGYSGSYRSPWRRSEGRDGTLSVVVSAIEEGASIGPPLEHRDDKGEYAKSIEVFSSIRAPFWHRALMRDVRAWWRVSVRVAGGSARLDADVIEWRPLA